MSALGEAINNDDPTILAKSRNTTCSRMLSSEDEGINFCQKSMFVGHKCDDVECCKCPFDTYEGGIAWLKKGVEMENNSSNVQEKPKYMFKKDDYIVITGASIGTYFPKYYCFKQREDAGYLRVFKDSAGDMDVLLIRIGSHTLGSNIRMMKPIISNVIILLNIQSSTNENKTTKKD